jgi:hypothetical protein
MSIFETRWRIVRDDYLGFEVQCRPWFCPIWFQPRVNTSHTIEIAEAVAERMRAGTVVKALPPIKRERVGNVVPCIQVRIDHG